LGNTGAQWYIIRSKSQRAYTAINNKKKYEKEKKRKRERKT